MALYKEKETDFGVPATYWRVTQTNVDWEKKTLYLSMLGYVNQEAREAGMQPLDSVNFLLEGEDFPLGEYGEGDMRVLIYGTIKKTEEWAIAEDV